MKIILEGDPIYQLRPRFRKIKNFISTYDPNAKEKVLTKTELQLHKPENFFLYPRISFLFYMRIPKSIKKRDQEDYLSGNLKHIVKPDIDNLVKFYLDCMDGIIFEKDQCVSLGPCMKLYHPEPKTIIYISETSRLVQAREMDLSFLPSEEFAK